MNSWPDTDDFNVTHGFHDVSGQWHSTSDEVRAALHDAMGPPQAGPPLWFVTVGDRSELQTDCHLVLED
ncbi:MAG: hypothetical protein R2705_16180 [Ilumatobacteraceae bacterium]